MIRTKEFSFVNYEIAYTIWVCKLGVNMSEQEAIEVIRSLGLTEYESKAYYTLVRRGLSTADEVHIDSGIPQSRIYDVLKKLEDKGWISREIGRPAKFLAKPPNETIQRLKSDFDKKVELALIELEILFRNAADIEKHETWFVRGSSVHKTLEKLVRSAKEIVICFLETTLVSKEYVEQILISLRYASGNIRIYMISNVDAIVEKLGIEVAHHLSEKYELFHFREFFAPFVQSVIGVDFERFLFVYSSMSPKTDLNDVVGSFLGIPTSASQVKIRERVMKGVSGLKSGKERLKEIIESDTALTQLI